jgi:hypothetical protein
MTTLAEIITDAFREGNILPLGKSPTAAQSAEALRLLNQLFSSVLGDEAGENFSDWPLGTFGQANPNFPVMNEMYRNRPPINHRLIALNEAQMTIYLSPMPQDGSRMGIVDPYGRLAAFPVILDGNGRPIEDQASLTLNTNGFSAEWFYRADFGKWVRITGLTATDTIPYPEEFAIFFTILLALRLNPRYGRSMDEQSAAVFKAEKSKFVNRYLQAMPLHIDDSISWPFMSTQSYNQPSVFSSQEDFNRGIGWR